jgi:hypothetical protein
MKMTLSVITLFLAANCFASATKVYIVKFQAYLYTVNDDIGAAINDHINHSLGPAITSKNVGDRSSLTEAFKYKVLNRLDLNHGLKKIDYSFEGRLAVEANVDMNNYKVIMPINTGIIWGISNGLCATKPDWFYFYQKWSPTIRGCKLTKGLDYEEFPLTSFKEFNLNSNHTASSFKIENEYELFFYYGSDFHSLEDFGHGETAYKKSMRAYKRRGFNETSDNNEKVSIFGHSNLSSRYQKLVGFINGVQTNIHFLLGNPDDATPNAKYEYFRFFKYAFQNGSGIYYGGHAGLGKNLNFDLLEKQYNEKVTYNSTQKQLMIFSGCSTYIQSSGFFFEKKPKNLVLATNGVVVKLRVNKYVPYSFYNLLRRTDSFTNTEIFNEIYHQFKESGASRKYLPMTVVESN